MEGINLYKSDKIWPTLVFGAFMHGDEVVGNKIIEYIESKAKSWDFSGTLIMITGNPRAKIDWNRFIDKDLNRSFWPDIENNENIYEYMRAHQIKSFFEDNKIKPDYVYDFHSTSSKSAPMMVCSSDQESMNHAREFDEGHLLTNILQHLRGMAFTEYMHTLGAVDIAFECGQHTELESLERGTRYLDRIWEVHFSNNFETNKNIPTTYFTTDMFFTSDTEFKFTKEWRWYDLIERWVVRGTEPSTGKELVFSEDKYIVMPNKYVARDIEHFGVARAAAFAKKIW